MTELDKLEAYLKDRNIPYKRIDEKPPLPKDLVAYLPREERIGFGERHQIIVTDKTGKRLWDVICQWGSYGFEQGLLEGWQGIFGKHDPVGWLTAEDVIKRIEENELCKRHTTKAPA